MIANNPFLRYHQIPEEKNSTYFEIELQKVELLI